MVLIIDNETADVETLKGAMRMRIFRPKDASKRYPGIVFYSEIFQITGPIARSAAVLAGHGFVVAVPEVVRATGWGCMGDVFTSASWQPAGARVHP